MSGSHHHAAQDHDDGGVRLFDRRLSISGAVVIVRPNNDLPAGYLPSTSMNCQSVSDLSGDQGHHPHGLDRQPLNQYYRPYAIPGARATARHKRVLFSSPGPGTVYKAG